MDAQSVKGLKSCEDMTCHLKGGRAMPAVLLHFSFVYSNSWNSLEESGFPSGIPAGCLFRELLCAFKISTLNSAVFQICDFKHSYIKLWSYRILHAADSGQEIWHCVCVF